MDDFQLRQIAEEVTSEIEKIKRCYNGKWWKKQGTK
jgi:hypothetical protein